MMTWDKFFDIVLTELPGVPSNLAEIHLRLAAIEFLDETQVWLVRADPINIVAADNTYSLVPPAGTTNAEVSQAKDVRFNGTPITFVTTDELRQSPTDYEATTSPTPIGYTQYTADTLTLIPTPSVDVTAGLTLKVALAPTLTATGVADWIGSKWYRDIANGAKATLMALPGKSWSSPEGAVMYRGQFEAAKTRATIEANRSFTRANSTIQMPRYG